MSEREKQLIEFLKMLDFKMLKNGQVEIVSNRFTVEELPDEICKYLDYYFTFIQLIG